MGIAEARADQGKEYHCKNSKSDLRIRHKLQEPAYELNCPHTQIHMLKSQIPNVFAFEERAFKEVN